jgi:AsmA protein
MDSNEHNSEVLGEDGPEAVEAEAVAGPRHRKRLIWSLVAVVLLLLLALTPPLLNVGRLRLRIAASMSAALGRPVHLDKVTMHLLPVPGFTLENLVVSEDPAFGYEPVIRAMKVELTPRLSSLWRRQVEIATIRFEVDDNGSAPSLNLVRNAQGQWNVQSLLIHAAQVNAEPTAQTTAGPAPRFPYIEATGGRVNLKLGEEKQPFSLLDADFALWLPTPESWHVRLEGKPTRTDTNASDTGTVTLEGQLQRAAKMGDVPVDLRATWHNAPLGEASKLITGTDAGWRGTLMVDATLLGPLKAAKWSTQVHLNDLRRADFVPAKLLDVGVECNGDVDVTSAQMLDPTCTLPTPAPAGSKEVGQVVAIGDTVNLPQLRSTDFGATGLRVGMTNVPDSWLMDWARLFSQRIPVKESPGGVVAGSITFAPASHGTTPGWQGEFRDTFESGSAAMEKPGREELKKEPWLTPSPLPSEIVVTASGAAPTFTVSPFNLSRLAKLPPLTLSGEATPQSYSLRLAGLATPQELNSLRSMVPVLGDGLDAAIPELLATPTPVSQPQQEAAKQLKLNVTCTRVWPAPQSCVNATVEPTKASHRRR